MGKSVLLCKKLFNVNAQTVDTDMAVFVDGEKIEKVCKQSSPADYVGYEIIDMGDKFVMPGVIDCHLHLSKNGTAHTLAIKPYMTVGKATLLAQKNAQTDLLAGFTTVRSCGDIGYCDIDLRNAINQGLTWGPRVVAAGSLISSTGGPSCGRYSPYIIEQTVMYGVSADGEAELRKAVRNNIKYGADFIKFMATGGAMTVGNKLDSMHLSEEEIHVVIETADNYGVVSSVHAHGPRGIKACAKAGVTSIEHGSIMDEECIEIISEKGQYVIPTFLVAERAIKYGPELGSPESTIQKSRDIARVHEHWFQRCLEEKIKIAFGTDTNSPGNKHGDQAEEFFFMVKYGMTEMQALTAATKTASELLRMENEIGSIDAGKYADIIAFDLDPLKDIKAMMNCAFVMKGGVIFKQ